MIWCNYKVTISVYGNMKFKVKGESYLFVTAKCKALYIYNRNSTETCVKLSPRNLNPDPYPSTPHKYLYLWSDHRANGVRLWLGFVIWFWVAFMAVRFWFLSLWMVVVVILCAFFFFFLAWWVAICRDCGDWGLQLWVLVMADYCYGLNGGIAGFMVLFVYYYFNIRILK